MCTGTGCSSSNSLKIIEEFEKQLGRQGMNKEAQVVRTGCFGLCALGPIVTIYPEGACYTHVTVEDVEEIVSEHIVKGRIVRRLLNRNDSSDGPATSLPRPASTSTSTASPCATAASSTPRASTSISAWAATRPWARSSPRSSRPSRSSTRSWPPACGAGAAPASPSGKKWQFTADAVSPDGVKYVCCNADEGDPGAFMDRSVLEGDPFSVLEAMTIAGYAVGAHQGYNLRPAEYPIAVKRLEVAIGQAKEYGLLGEEHLRVRLRL